MDPDDQFDVIIVGAGPAGIFAALELAEKSVLRILVVEKGNDLAERDCPARHTGRCVHCDPCAITCGWGGAGAFSDGKLTLSPEVGGWLGEYLGAEDLLRVIADVDTLWRGFGAPEELRGSDADTVASWRVRALQHRLRLVSSPIRHMGTDRCAEVIGAMRRSLEGRVRVLTDTAVARVQVDDLAPTALSEGAASSPAGGGGAPAAGRPATRRLGVSGIVTEDGSVYQSPVVILAPGREGASWLQTEAERLGLAVTSNAVDIGVRVEVPAHVTEAITRDLYEPKLLYTTSYFEDPVRTFCVNPNGVVSTESYGDVVTVNGHSYGDGGPKTLSTNFALLVSTRFTHPFKDPITYGKSIARLANVLGRDIIVQRLADLKEGRRTTPERLARCTVPPTLPAATPGDLSFVLPYRHLRDIMDMIDALDGLLPGVGGRDTLLYGVEVKFYSSRLELGTDLQTRVRGLYAVGDGAGVTRGVVQASASGLVAARAVLAAAEASSAG